MIPTPDDIDALRTHLGSALAPHLADKDKHSEPNLEWVIPVLKRLFAEELLVYSDGNQSEAARIAGVNRGTLRDWAGLSKPKCSRLNNSSQ
ncbi:hypothetical protein COR52_27815 [Vibrio mediterranei]|uniref:DNA binding HTH domain-containing protein n=2 Tax=Vibrio mediterranei TaxID=689 RepID=A0ABX5D457_9VIBR|nr:hypothetical protein COR52_27815 [Vibrio mediterranei]PRQ64450.1 hypothetical protein COR51_27450 [Vibrio mediterranei]